MCTKSIPLEIFVQIAKFLKDRKSLLNLFLCIRNLYACVKSSPKIIHDIEYSCLEKVVQRNKMYFTLGKLKHDNYKEFYENGAVKIDCFYDHGKLYGEYKRYRKNNSLTSSCTYKKGRREGKFIAYHENGQISCESFYVLDKLEGEYKEYYQDKTSYPKPSCERGQLSLECFYKAGKLHGECKRWWYGRCNNLVYSHSYKNGVKDGEWKAYYFNGVPRSLKVYQDDELKLIEKWREDGQLAVSRRYEKGKLTSIKRWDRYGHLYEGWHRK